MMINRDELKKLVSQPETTVVDVRTPEEFEEGHMAGTINIPLDTVLDSLDTFRSFGNIILICRSGQRSGFAKQLLESNGFCNVVNGGGWEYFNEIINGK